MTKVTQDDREAAAKVAVQVEMRELILAGKADYHAEPWAAHRITADLAGYERGQRETAERIVAWLWRKVSDELGQRSSFRKMRTRE